MAENSHPNRRHVVAEAILSRALSSLAGVESAVVPTFHAPSETESEAMAAINDARAKLENARQLLHLPGSSTGHR